MGDDTNYSTMNSMESETKSDTDYDSGGPGSSASTTSGSEKQLVPPREKGRMEIGYGVGSRGSFVYPEEDSISLNSVISPQVHKKSKPKFMSPSSPSLSHSGFLTPNRSSPASLRKHKGAPSSLLTQAILGDMAGRRASYKENSSDIFDTYLQVPVSHPWCVGDKMCASCQLKEDAMSTCSSIGPPPTFTFMDNIRPIRPRQTCSCSGVFIATMILSVLVLVLIGAFILYIEMVVRRTEYIPDPM